MVIKLSELESEMLEVGKIIKDSRINHQHKVKEFKEDKSTV